MFTNDVNTEMNTIIKLLEKRYNGCPYGNKGAMTIEDYENLLRNINLVASYGTKKDMLTIMRIMRECI